MTGQSSAPVETHGTNEGQHSESEMPTEMIGEFTVDHLLQRAQDLVAERTAEWDINQSAAPSRIPKYDRNGKSVFFVLKLFNVINPSHGTFCGGSCS